MNAATIFVAFVASGLLILVLATRALQPMSCAGVEIPVRVGGMMVAAHCVAKADMEDDE